MVNDIDKLKCQVDFYASLDMKYTEFFYDYSQEEANNIYVESFRKSSHKKYTHLLKTFFSDVLSFQSKRNNIGLICDLYFLPVLLVVKDSTGLGSFWKLNHPEKISYETLQKNTCFNTFVNTFVDRYVDKSDIEKNIIDLDNNSLYTQLFLEYSNSNDLKDTNIDDLSNVQHNFKDMISHTIYQYDKAVVKEAESKDYGSFKSFKLDYHDDSKELDIDLFAVFHITNLRKSQDNDVKLCELDCNEISDDNVIHECLDRTFKKLFVIALLLEKFVRADEHKEQVERSKDDVSRFSNIRKPLQEIITKLSQTTKLISFVDRQLNPAWISLLNISKHEYVSKIFRRNAMIDYRDKNGTVKTFLGIHNFEDEYSSSAHNRFLDDVRDYFQHLTELIDMNEDLAKIRKDPDLWTERCDMLMLIAAVISEQENYENKYRFIKFVKHVIFDIQDNNKKITYLQILFYVLMSCRNVNFKIGHHVKSVMHDPSTLNGLMKFLDNQIVVDMLDNYKILREGQNPSYPNVKLCGNVSPAEFCEAVAGLIGEELQDVPGQNKSVTLKNDPVGIISLGPHSDHLAIIVKCKGSFPPDSILRVGDDDDSIYHGMRSSLRIIEKALDVRRKFVNFKMCETQSCYHPFVFFQYKDENSNDATTIRIIIGDIFSRHVNYTLNDFEVQTGAA